jgi:hypothetical protein
VAGGDARTRCPFCRFGLSTAHCTLREPMNPLQRAVFRRKIAYLAVILGLFTVSMFWRGMLPIPLSGARAASPSAVQREADRLASRTILNRSVALELREVEQGEQDIESSTRQLLALAGRGFYVAYLWHSAIDKQKRNDFHKMDQLIRRVTQLQPHFITPWIFQSWNIAYNVSVEMQGSGDMYYYIARGIDLLAEGERRQGRIDPETNQRIGSPDMRFQIAFYYQNKFGVSDNVEVLRCLFQLSCIPPDDRNTDPGVGLVNTDNSVNLAKFEAFCRKYPHLVRRLRGEAFSKGGDALSDRRIAEALKCPLPEDVIAFLRANREVPSRYKNATELNDGDKQFPVLPPAFPKGPLEANPTDATDDEVKTFYSAFRVARAWYVYSTVPLPPHPRDENGKAIPAGAPMPSSNPLPGEYDPIRYRLPRQPMLILFRQGAPRAQSFQAEMEQKEGWFDDEGWSIDDQADEGQKWFPNSAAPVVVGAGTPWSRKEWETAARMWYNHGEEYGLSGDALRDSYKKAAAERPAGSADPTPEQLKDPEYQLWALKAAAEFYYGQNRQVSNFPFFLATSQAEQQSDTVDARKTLWLAEQSRKLGKKPQAIRLYEKGLRQWRDVLAKNQEFHRGERSDRIEEETYAYELAYLRLIVQDDQRVREKAAALLGQAKAAFQVAPLALSLASPTGLSITTEEAKWVVAETDPAFSPFVGVMVVPDARNGGPWIRPEIKAAVRGQQGVQRAAPLPQQPEGGGEEPGAPPVRPKGP